MLIPEDPVWNWRIEYLCDEIQRDLLRVCRLPERWEWFETERYLAPAKNREPKLHDVLINVPPGSSKSTILSVMAPAWLWTVDPTIRVCTASYSGDLAMGLAVKSRDVIQSGKYRQYFPEVEIRIDSNNKQHYINTAGGERFATSVGGTSTGMHFHVIFCDDLLNPKQAASETQLEEAAEFLDTTLSTRKVDKAVSITFLIMQRLNELDPAGRWLMKQKESGKKLKYICLPGTATKRVHPPELAERYTDGLLDPIRMTHEILADMKVDLGTYGYAGQVEQNPSPEGGGIWQQNWIIPVPDKDMPSRFEMTGYGTDADTAYTDKKTNAASAFLVSGMHNGRMYIDNVGWYWKMFPDLVKLMRDVYPEPHYVEAKASGLDLINMLKSEGIAAIGVNVAADKLARARMATPKAEAGLVYCRASILDKILHDEAQGILKFPNGPQADLADTVAQAILRHLGRPERKIIVGWGKRKTA